VIPDHAIGAFACLPVGRGNAPYVYRQGNLMKIFQKPFRFSLLIFLSLNLSLILFVSSAFGQYFTISRYHSDIMIDRDSSFVVKESIEVTFDRPRHGIYREIPFKYREEVGHLIETPTRVLSVKNESGKEWKYQVSKKGHVIQIRVGDPKRFVDGRQTYVITYEVENAILFFDDHDELYWNVTGNDWKAPIEEASANVSLVLKNSSKNLWAACYTGPYGSKESQCSFDTYENGAKFLATRKLNIGEGFTIAFGWDRGLISPPSSWKKLLWAINLRENWVFLFPPLALIYMIFHWKRRGRDPKVRESVTVMYEPPKFNDQFLSPGEVGALIDERLDARDITSTILGLAVKGYMKIEEQKEEGLIFDKKDYYIKKVKEPDAALNPFETELMRSLVPATVPGTLVSSLKNRFYTNLPFLKKTLYGELIKKKYFLSNPEKVRNLYGGIGFLIMVFASLAFLFLISESPAKSIIAAVLTGLPVLLFAKVMPAKTRAGASAYMDILGFQEFLNRAEKDRLEKMGDTDLFSKFLPYAVALDVADNWAKAFEGIYQNPPDWYGSPGGFRTFNPYVFTHSVNSVTSDLTSAMTSAPRGSGIGGGGGGGGGFGGGGSSGGGFGGGGGGSW
jgi:uncharacterized membrane protein